MFNNQETVYHSNKYLKLYEEWKKENEPSRIGGYLDGRFFHWVGLQYRDNKLYTDEFWEMIDILIRKNMTSSKFITESNETKSEFYSNAIYKIDKYLFNKYDEKKQSLFVYATSVVTSAFWDVIRQDKRQNEIKKKLANSMRGSLPNDIEIDKEQNGIFSEEYQEEIIESNNKLEEILSKSVANNYTIKRNVSLLKDLNQPKFKRKYLTLQSVVEIERYEDTSLIFDDEYIPKKIEVPEDKGVVVEYYDVSIFNERNGTHQNFFLNQSLCARKNGYQYMAIFSDIYEELEGAVIQKLNNLFLETEHGLDYSDSIRSLENEYIKLKDVKDENVIKPIWYGLRDDKHVRISVDNTLESYMKFLEDNKDATRIYSCGRMRID